MKHIVIFKNDTITLTKPIDKEDFWLYDTTRGMNLAMGAKTEQEAFVLALTYYQKRLKAIETEYNLLKDKVDIFINGFMDEDKEFNSFCGRFNKQLTKYTNNSFKHIFNPFKQQSQ